MKNPIQPLNPAAELAYHEYPVIQIPENRRTPIKRRAQDIAEQWFGDPEDHFIGKIGEWAVASYLGVENQLDLEVYADGGDGGFDLDYDGQSIEIKTARQGTEQPRLPIGHKEPLNAEWYVLAKRIGKTNVQLIGAAPRGTVQAVRDHCDHSDMGEYSFVSQEYLFQIT
jgi:hypothetical protein